MLEQRLNRAGEVPDQPFAGPEQSENSAILYNTYVGPEWAVENCLAMSEEVLTRDEFREYEAALLARIEAITPVILSESGWRAERPLVHRKAMNLYGITIERRDYSEEGWDGSYPLYRIRCVLPNVTPREYFFDYERPESLSWEENVRRNPKLKFFRTLTEVKDGFSDPRVVSMRLNHTGGKSGTALAKDREFLAVNLVADLGEGVLFAITKSVVDEHESRVAVQDARRNLRAKMLNGFRLKEVEGGTDVTFFNWLHPRGKLSANLLKVGLGGASYQILKRGAIEIRARQQQ